MIQLIFAVYIFLQILYLLVLFDVIFSWISIFIWKPIRPQFIAQILNPIYFFIKKHIPTTFWPFEFTPIIVLLMIWFFQWILLSFFPEISRFVQLYSVI